jgi:hypothetical protein
MKPILFVLSLLVVGACYSEEPGIAVGYGGGYGYAGPQMAYVAPGVQVIADYDYPVFYSDGYYWRYNGGMWYRSGFYNRGWALSYNVPVGVRGIARPEGYAHYRGNWNGGYNRGYNGGYRGGYQPNQNWGRNRGSNASGGVRVNDHRGGGSRPAYRPGPSRPVVRDHRR